MPSFQGECMKERSVCRVSKREFDRFLRSLHKVIFAVPDLHGCFMAAEKMVHLLEQYNLPAVFLGDYVDRGESSIRTIQSLCKAQGRNPNWIFLAGNHEAMLLESIAANKDLYSQFNCAFQEYSANGGISGEHLLFLNQLSLYYESRALLFMHAGISSEVARPVAEHDPNELLWSYEVSPLWTGKKIVRGHRLVPKPVETGNHISLETGVWIEDGVLSVGVLSDSIGVERALVGWIEVSRDGRASTYYLVTTG